MKRVLHKLKNRRAKKDIAQTAAGAPRITNETVAEHREEVLSSARKYIYPLQHSKHKIVLTTLSLFVVAIVGFFAFTTISLYKLKSHSTFLYGVTKVVPFPVAKAGDSFVAYENYLFELRHYIHYYQNQQKLDFNSESGQQQLAEFKKRALEKVVNDAYVKQLAKKYKITVSNKEVANEIQIVRAQNRLGESDKVFEDVLKEYWGWSVADFQRSLKQQLLAEKLLPKLDPTVAKKINAAKVELNSGADFAAVAKKYSEDPVSKDSGGEYPTAIDRANREITAQASAVLFKLQPGQVSDVIDAGYSLEIVKNIETQGDKLRAAHIVVNYQDISAYLNDYKDQHKAHLYITP
jgi:parvulin-like peptidyl-prolyl isomerase